jgi:hypothetical protein
MRRVLAIVLLTLLPLQFCWGAVASYCLHEQKADAAHLGHHEHQHRADASGHAAEVVQDMKADKALGAIDFDCGYCHGTGSLMPTVPLNLSSAVSTALPRTVVDEAAAANTATRPERPQWLPLA